jgi:hypothetical protein
VWIRAADVADNVSQNGPFEVYVYVPESEAVGGYTDSAMIRESLWLRVVFLILVVDTGIVAAAASGRRRRERRVVGRRSARF